MKDVKVTDGQCLLDLAIQEYGHVEGMAYILAHNTLSSMESILAPGSTVKVLDAVPRIDGGNQGIANQFAVLDRRVNGGHKYVAPKVLEPEAITFINTLPLTDSIDKDYVNCIVGGLKTANLFVSAIMIKPYVGATAGKHKWNLVNPVDDVAAHIDTYYGGLTHTSQGVVGNGTTGYADANLNASTAFSSKNRTYVIYMNDVNENSYDFGVLNGAFVGDSFASRFAGTAYPSIKSISNGGPFTNSTSAGCWIITRDNNTIKVFRNGTLVYSFTVSNDIIPNASVVMGAARIDGIIQYFSTRTYKYFAAHDITFTNSQAAAYSAVIIDAQTLKGRA